MEPKRYVVVKNHVREIQEEDFSLKNRDVNHTNPPKKKIKRETTSSSDDISNNENNSNYIEQLKRIDDDDNEYNIQRPTSSKGARKKRNNNRTQTSFYSESDSNTEISASDLEELKTVYKKCKTVIKKIETKYGHLLHDEIYENGLDNVTKKRKIKLYTEPNKRSECACMSNKKIYFNENGQEISENGHNRQDHICNDKLQNYERLYRLNNQNLEVEYDIENDVIPDDIEELTDLLRNPYISTSYRNSLIEKIKSIRNENLNILRFEKVEIVQSLKTNPDEIMSFPGSNLSSLPGYPK